MQNIKKKQLTKAILLFLSIIIFSIILCNSSYGAYTEYIKGDVNADSKVNNIDILLTLRHIYGDKTNSKKEWCFDEKNKKIADINNDENINNIDILMMLRYVAASKSNEIDSKNPEWKKSIKKNSLNVQQDNVELDLKSGQTEKLIVTGENIGSIKYTSLDNNIANISSEGIITPRNVGNTEILIQASNGLELRTKVKVINSYVYVQNIKLDKTNINLDLNGTKTTKITATIEPANANNKNLSWTSNNIGVATVDENGNVTAVGVGNATITAKTLDGSNITKTCQVNVTRTPIKVTSITLNSHNQEIDLTRDNKTITLTATINPANADNKQIIWESKNPNVATVSNGVVTGIAEGMTDIIAKSAENSRILDVCTVTVIKGLTIESSSTEYLDVINDSLTLLLFQSGSTKDSISWSVDNTNVVRLESTTESGTVVRRTGEGVTTVRAISSSGKKASYTVGVKKEKVLFTGASCTSLMANERKDADTGKVQNIDYGRLKKDDNLFFEAYGGTGLLWYLDSETRRSLMNTSENDYGKLLFSTKYPDKETTGKSRYAMQDIRKIINGVDKKTEHLSIAFDIEGNDIRKAENEEQALYLSNVYTEVIVKLAKDYPDVTFYCIPKSAYPEEANWSKYNDLIRKFNLNIQAVISASNISNLSYKTYYTFTKNLYENDKNAGISSDQHPNAYTTQAMFDQILKYMKITK